MNSAPDWNVIGSALVAATATLLTTWLTILNVRWRNQTHAMVEHASFSGVRSAFQERDQQQPIIAAQSVLEFHLIPLRVQADRDRFQLDFRLAVATPPDHQNGMESSELNGPTNSN